MKKVFVNRGSMNGYIFIFHSQEIEPLATLIVLFVIGHFRVIVFMFLRNKTSYSQEIASSKFFFLFSLPEFRNVDGALVRTLTMQAPHPRFGLVKERFRRRL